MQTRHIVMLALGGVIGTGLFLTSGYTVNQAGPMGAVIAYIIGALMVYMVMMCLGELAVQMPETGSFSTYATRFLGPGTGYTVAWLYWLTWTVAIGSEFTAAGILMTRWFPDTPVWIWSALFAGVVFLTNVVSVRLFAETEFWLSLIKVVTVIVFLMIGGGAILGLLNIEQAHSIGLGNFTREGLFPTGFMPIAMTLLAVAFASAWAIQGWRKDADIDHLKAGIATANQAAADARAERTQQVLKAERNARDAIQARFGKALAPTRALQQKGFWRHEV